MEIKTIPHNEVVISMTDAEAYSLHYALIEVHKAWLKDNPNALGQGNVTNFIGLLVSEIGM